MQIDDLSIKIYDTREEMGVVASVDVVEYIKSLLATQDEVNIIFAAAPSQNDFLMKLSESDLDWSKINAFHMDEYVGLDVDAPQTFRKYLYDHIFSYNNFKSINYILNSNSDSKSICDSYVKLLNDNPIDIVFMGVGENGHIAFNDPHVAFFDDPEVIKVVELDQACRNQQVNDGCFPTIGDVPTHAITLTIPTLMSAKQIFCIVPTTAKADAISALYHGKIEESCPASILRNHKSATLYCDVASAAGIL